MVDREKWEGRPFWGEEKVASYAVNIEISEAI